MEPCPENIDVLAAQKTCKVHGLPLRPKQRNCRECNRLANQRYRQSLAVDLEVGRMVRHEMGRRSPMSIAFRKALKCKPQRPGFVYFIQANPGDEIKIGFSTDPYRRLRALQTAATKELHLLAAMPGMPELERQTHERFAAHRTIGEWFTPAREILDLIENLKHMDGAFRAAS